MIRKHLPGGLLLSLGILGSVVVSLFPSPAWAAPTEAELKPLKSWIAAQAELKTMEIDFVQKRKLASLRRPTESPGQIWMEAGGRFRWQVGKPLRTVMVKGEKELHVLRVKRKVAEVYGLEALKDDKRLRGLAFIEAGFPKSLKEFQETFNVTGIKMEATGLVTATLELKDKKMAVAVKSVNFTIDPRHNILRRVHVEFRDKSWVETVVRAVRRNPTISAEKFKLGADDLKAYKIKRKTE